MTTLLPELTRVLHLYLVRLYRSGPYFIARINSCLQSTIFRRHRLVCAFLSYFFITAGSCSYKNRHLDSQLKHSGMKKTYGDLKVSATFNFASHYCRDTPWGVSTLTLHDLANLGERIFTPR